MSEETLGTEKNIEQTANDAMEELSKLPNNDATQIDAIFYSLRKNSKAYEVLSNGNLLVKGDYVEFPLRNPFYISEIRISGSDESKRPNLKLEFHDTEENRTIKAQSVSDDDSADAVFDVNRLVSGFRITSGALIFKKENIKSVQAYGYSLEDFPEINRIFGLVNGHKTSVEAELKSRLDAAQAEEARIENAQVEFQQEQEASRAEIKQARLANEQELEADRVKQEEELATEKEEHEKSLAEVSRLAAAEKDTLNSLKAESIATKSVVDSLSSEKARLETQLKELKGELQNTEKMDRELKQEISAKETDISNKKDLIIKLTDEIRILHSDKSLFAEDMVGFTKQARIITNIYLGVATISLVGAFWLIYTILGGMGASFDVFVEKNGSLKMAHLLMGQLPKAIGEASALIFIYYFTRPFIQEVFSLVRRKLRLSEISILSRDITAGALNGSQLEDDERNDVRIAIRMYYVRKYFTGEYDNTKPQVVSDADLPEIPPTLITTAFGWLKKSKKSVLGLEKTPIVKAQLKVEASTGDAKEEQPGEEE